MNDNPEPELIKSAPSAISTVPPEIESDIVIAFVGALGVNLQLAEDAMKVKIEELGYKVIYISVTGDILPHLDPKAREKYRDQNTRIHAMMDAGNRARENHGKNILALGVAAEIARRRKGNQTSKMAYLIHSLKHPDEVRCLREIYPRGFYLIGVHSPPDSRRKYLVSLKGIGGPEAKKLMERDRKERADHGQQLVDTFHLSDFFAGWEEVDDEVARKRNIELLKNSIYRFVEIMFGHPNKTPTFGEYAMFLAFSTALRSADLSRQVGAVIASRVKFLRWEQTIVRRLEVDFIGPHLTRAHYSLPTFH